MESPVKGFLDFKINLLRALEVGPLPRKKITFFHYGSHSDFFEGVRTAVRSTRGNGYSDRCKKTKAGIGRTYYTSNKEPRANPWPPRC